MFALFFSPSMSLSVSVVSVDFAGIIVPPNGYLQGLRAICDKHDILLIFDEVMAGLGRTGEWFACDNWKVVPDILCMAKGVTSA